MSQNKKYLHWVIGSKKELLDLINIINGYFRTPKIKALHRLIDYLNIRFNYNMIKKDLDNSRLVDNAWLSGFADADGGFSLYVTKRSDRNNALRVMHSFRIELAQYSKTHDASLFPICSKIASFFKVNLYSRERVTNFSKDNEINSYTYIIVASTVPSRAVVRYYFDKFPLFSAKYEAYANWCIVDDIAKSRGLLTGSINYLENLDKINMLKHQFNTKSINQEHFKSHLISNFYL